MPKNATKKDLAAHAEARAFYDMTGETNFYDYMTTESKRVGRKTMLEYLQKSTGVFNGDKMLSKEEVAEMKERLKKNKGNIWHGFISLSEEESEKIDTPKKCQELIKRTFGAFLKDAGLSAKNIDLMCALHKDRPHHLHIHFTFWEKEPKFKGKDGKLQYRRKGKIDKKAIDNMFVRLGLYLSNKKDRLYKSRDEATNEMKRVTGVKEAMYTTDEIRKSIVELAKALPKSDDPKNDRIYYGSKEMEKFRPQVDKIVEMLLAVDRRAREADKRFYERLAERKREVENICGKPTALSTKNQSPEEMEKDLPTYHNKIDEKNITIIQQIEDDYKRRQGNLVLNLAKYIKPEYFERKIGVKYKANDIHLKRRINMSRKKINYACKKFFSTFGQESEFIERDFSHRLQDIEEEIARERDKKNKKGEDYKN